MAGSTILLRNGENRAVLANSIAARLVGIGTSWNKIRAGIHFQIDGTTSIAALDFALGFSSGTAAVYGDASATHFVGAIADSGWAISSGFYTGLTIDPGKKVGATVTKGTALSSGVVARGEITVGITRSMLFVDITKGSPDYTFQLFYRSGLNTTDVSEATFIAQMESAVPAFANHTLGAAQVLAVDEGVDGVLDSVNLFWAPMTQKNEISILAVTVLS